LPPSVLSAARQQNTYPMGLVMLPQVVSSMKAQKTVEDEELSNEASASRS
jgi:hypothetical protein